MNISPNLYLSKVEEISIDILQKNNIKAIILDVDNTLIDYYKNLSSEKIKWVQNLLSKGIKIYILSNTNKKQKSKFKQFVEKMQEKAGAKPIK